MPSFILHKLISDKIIPHREPGKILDLGCGNGEDSLQLAQLGYQVDAVDKNPATLANLRATKTNPTIRIQEDDMTNFIINPRTYQVIITNNSLFFLSTREQILEIIQKATDGLIDKGIFAFSLLGPNDEWTKDERALINFDYQEIQDLLSQIKLKLYFKSTEEGYGQTKSGNLKYWHLHRFFYQRNGNII